MPGFEQLIGRLTVHPDLWITALVGMPSFDIASPGFSHHRPGAARGNGEGLAGQVVLLTLLTSWLGGLGPQ